MLFSIRGSGFWRAAGSDQAIEFFTGPLGFELAEDSALITNDGRAKRWVVVRPPGGHPAAPANKPAGTSRRCSA